MLIPSPSEESCPETSSGLPPRRCFKMNTKHCIALIPARSGSKRIKNKNIKTLAGHPLLAYTIQAAIDSQIFTQIIVSTDSEQIAKIAKYYGARIPFLRPAQYATYTSPDIEWVKYTLEKLVEEGIKSDCFSILRPTSPFRSTETIKRAWKEFILDGKIDSLRAVEKCRQHPAKMWIIKNKRMYPVVKNPDKSATPWYSTPYQALPPIYAQNASLEIAWNYLPLKKNTISGDKILPFVTKNFEGYDLNDEKDWIYAEYLIKHNKVKLPKIMQKPCNC